MELYDFYVACPVRNARPEQRAAVRCWVQSREREGLSVYWSERDTVDCGGCAVRINQANRGALMAAKAVAVYYAENSEGLPFDIGMAWALQKPLVLVAPVAGTKGESFANLVGWWAGNE